MAIILHDRNISLASSLPRLVTTSVTITTSGGSAFVKRKNGGPVEPVSVILSAITTVFTNPTYKWYYANSTSPDTWNLLGTTTSTLALSRTEFLSHLGSGINVTYKVVANQVGYSTAENFTTLNYSVETDEPLVVEILRESSTVAGLSDGTTTVPVPNTGNTIRVKRGSIYLNYGTSGTNTWSIATSFTGGITLGSLDTTTDVTKATYADLQAMTADTDSATITYTVTVRDASGVALPTITKSQTIVKTKNGSNGKALSVTATTTTFKYNSDNSLNSPTGSQTLTLSPFGFTGTWYWTVTVDSGSESARIASTTSTTYSYTPKASYVDMPDVLTFKVYDVPSGSTPLATATVSMSATIAGATGTPGTPGLNAKSITLQASATAFKYNADNSLASPLGTQTITIIPSNLPDPWYWTVKVDSSAESSRTSSASSTTYTYTPQASYVNMPDTLIFTVYDQALGGNLLAAASIGMSASRTGDAGDKSVTLYLYKWSFSETAIPTEDSTYNWATGVLDPGIGLTNKGWSTSVSGAGSAGQTLYALTKTITIGGGYTGISTIDWDGTTLGPVATLNSFGYNTKGDIGFRGADSRIAYIVTTSSTPPALGAVQPVSGDTLPDGSARPGSTALNTWSATPKAILAEGEFMYQSDGSYDSVSNTTNWQFAYLSNLKVGQLSAISSYLGQVVVSTSGRIASGTVSSSKTYGDSTAGFFLGWDTQGTSAYKLDVGDSTKYIRWNGSSLDIAGNIRGGQTGYATGTGFFLGYDTDAYKLSIGNTTNYMRWNGTTLELQAGITGSSTIGSTAASTVVTGSTNGTSAWSKFSGAGNTLPSGNVEFNFAGSTSKGGNATNTDSVGTQTASTVATATLNFNNNNDRNSSTPTDPVVATNGTAVDHTINTDGSVDISFEWSYTTSTTQGAANNIDGFIVYVYQSSSNTAYTFGTSVADEQVYYLTPDRRALILYGVAANKYYTFAVRAYRVVDSDVDANGYKWSTLVKATGTGENPYLPSSSVAFGGDITGTINSTAASTVVSNASLGASAYATVGYKLNKNAADILTGEITLDTGGMVRTGNATTGVYLAPNGLYGVYGGVEKFSINNTNGNVSMTGTLYGGSATGYNTGAPGIFSGLDGGTYKFRVGNVSTTANKSRIVWDGSAFTVYNSAGNVTMSAGDIDYSVLLNKPDSLADINSTESTKLTGIETGATVGATAGTNLKDSGGTVLGDTAIKNSSITIDANGAIQNIGSAGTVVANNKISLTVGSNGAITATGGVTTSGSVSWDGIKSTAPVELRDDRIAKAISSAGFIAPTIVVPDGVNTGLYLGSTKLGYYNQSTNTWRTYMDNTGQFFLTGTGSNYLSWNGTDLTISGTINAVAGTQTIEIGRDVGPYGGHHGISLSANDYNNCFIRRELDGAVFFLVGNGTSNYLSYNSVDNKLYISGDLVAVNGTFSGTLTADAINAVNTINIVNSAVSDSIQTAYSSSSVYSGSGTSTATGTLTGPTITAANNNALVLWFNGTVNLVNGAYQVSKNVFAKVTATAKLLNVSTGNTVVASLTQEQQIPVPESQSFTNTFSVALAGVHKGITKGHTYRLNMDVTVKLYGTYAGLETAITSVTFSGVGQIQEIKV